MKIGGIFAPVDVDTATEEEVNEALQGVTSLYVLVDDFDLPEFEEKPDIFYIGESQKATKEDEKMILGAIEGETLKKRVLMVWEKMFPKATRPLAVHYLGNYQLDDICKLNRQYFRYAVLTYLHDIEGTEMARWNALLALDGQDIDLLRSFLRSGKAVYDYHARGFGGDEADVQISEETTRMAARIGDLEKSLTEKKNENTQLREELSSLKKEKANTAQPQDAFMTRPEKDTNHHPNPEEEAQKTDTDQSETAPEAPVEDALGQESGPGTGSEAEEETVVEA